MAKFHPKRLTSLKEKEILDEFFRVITSLESVEEVKIFFIDLLNKQETVMLSRRLMAARLLDKGFTQEDVSRIMKMGKSTVAGVARWFNYGNEGYKIALKRIEEMESKILKKENKKILESTALSPEYIKKKYASYFWPEEAIGQLMEKSKEVSKKKAKKKSVIDNFKKTK
ncbi:MAG: YerC/YecD family TrpR-related protein [Patescibacteria group bacterium]|nr:YerC/YecD family TrpR-related protein [Patescibacteria group bacterium]